jgi:hypothetical protein
MGRDLRCDKADVFFFASLGFSFYFRISGTDIRALKYIALFIVCTTMYHFHLRRQAALEFLLTICRRKLFIIEIRNS